MIYPENINKMKHIEVGVAEETLATLKEKYEQGLIGEEEYKAKRTEFLNKI